MPRIRSLLAALALWPAPVLAEGPCRTVTFEGTGYAVCEVQAGADIRLFHTAPDGKIYGAFGRIETEVKAQASGWSLR